MDVAGGAAGHPPCRGAARRRAARRRCRERFGFRGVGAANASVRRPRMRARHAALAGAWRQGRGLRRFAERRHHGGHRVVRREGSAPENVKRYTTLGMGTDQGKTANVVALGRLSRTDRGVYPRDRNDWVRLPIRRSPGARLPDITAARISRRRVCRRLTPGRRRTAGNSWKQACGSGRYFTSGRARLAARHRAGGRAVRRAVGVCDVSTLGKIDIQGPDAASLLDRVYMNKFSTLTVGRARYGGMLREDRFAMDDGTVARFGEHHFFMTTTTANAGKVLQHLEFCRQVLWPELDVRLVSVSDHWAQYAVAGPRRATCWPSSSMRPSIFPTRAFRAWARASSRSAAASRPGCSASPSPARWLTRSPSCAYGDATIRALMQAGAEFDIRPTAPRR